MPGGLDPYGSMRIPNGVPIGELRQKAMQNNRNNYGQQ